MMKNGSEKNKAWGKGYSWVMGDIRMDAIYRTEGVKKGIKVVLERVQRTEAKKKDM